MNCAVPSYTCVVTYLGVVAVTTVERCLYDHTLAEMTIVQWICRSAYVSGLRFKDLSEEAQSLFSGHAGRRILRIVEAPDCATASFSF